MLLERETNKILILTQQKNIYIYIYIERKKEKEKKEELSK